MAIARVVTFDGVDSDRIQQMKQEMESGERPDDIPEAIVADQPEHRAKAGKE